MESATPETPESNPAAETIAAPVAVQARPDDPTATAAPPTVVLEIVGGPMDGVTARAAKDVVTVGRSPASDLCLHLDPLVSMRHAQLVREGPRFWLEDLQSRNGTHIGSQRIEGRTLVASGTLFTVGGTCVELLIL